MGEMGELHPVTQDKLGMTDRACVAELNLETILDSAKTEVHYSPLC